MFYHLRQEPSSQLKLNPNSRTPSSSHLPCVPSRSRSDVGQGPSGFELQRRLVVHRQEDHEAGQQTGFYDLLQRWVAFLRQQLPEISHTRRDEPLDSSSLGYRMACVFGAQASTHLAAWQPRVWDSLLSEFTSLIMSSMDKDATYRTKITARLNAEAVWGEFCRH